MNLRRPIIELDLRLTSRAAFVYFGCRAFGLRYDVAMLMTFLMVLASLFDDDDDGRPHRLRRWWRARRRPRIDVASYARQDEEVPMKIEQTAETFTLRFEYDRPDGVNVHQQLGQAWSAIDALKRTLPDLTSIDVLRTSADPVEYMFTYETAEHGTFTQRTSVSVDDVSPVISTVRFNMTAPWPVDAAPLPLNILRMFETSLLMFTPTRLTVEWE